jgi:hypothetical protein
MAKPGTSAEYGCYSVGVVGQADHGVTAAPGVARMGEQGHYRPPRWRAESGSVSLEALEAAFGTGAHGPGPADGPDHGDAHVRQPEADGRGPGTNRPEPPWLVVLATTVRLWLRRRIAALGRLSPRRRWAVALAALAVMALAVTGLIVSVARQAGPAPAAGRKAAQAGTPGAPGHQGSGTAAAGHAAAVWIARQVSRDAIVGCDPGMCGTLEGQGFPARNLLVLRPGAAGLCLCDLIVATPAVRDLLGSRLERETASAVIAGFGSGAARVEVRAVAPGGEAAYRAALAADWAARRKAAAQLVSSPRIHAAGAARQELLTGQVDSRLLITLAGLSVSYPVNVVAFGDSAPGASAGVPLREVEVSAAGSPASGSAELQRIRSMVLAQHGEFRPAHVSLVRLAGGGAALRIEFGVPSPLGLLLGRPVTQ